MSISSPPLASAPPSTVADVVPHRKVGSLWRRLFAAFFDALIVGAAGTMIALPFFEAFSRLGAWGRLVGFCLAMFYFGVLNSRIGNGQTVGKRWLHLRVVDASGQPISILRSVARYSILSAPFFLNNLALPITLTSKFVLYLLAAIVFGLGPITIYLVLFNRRTRQGVHDLVVGSYVAEANKTGALHLPPTWKGHWAVLGLLVAFGFVGGKVLQTKLMKLVDFPAMSSDARVVYEMDNVQAVTVSEIAGKSWSGDENKKIYVVNVFWAGKGNEAEGFAMQVAARVLYRHPDLMDRDRLRIVIIRGYDLGIAHARVNYPFEDSPAAWQARLGAVRKTSPVGTEN